jgi:PAS domain S-box-containing protein
MRVSEKFTAFARETHNQMMHHTIRCQQQVVKCLGGTTRLPASFEDDTFSESEFLEFARAADLATVTTFFHIAKQVACFTYGQYEEALEHATLAAPTMVTVSALPVGATHHFYRALTLAALHRHSPSAQKGELEAGLAHELKKLAHWAESCPENYQNRHALVAAEAARIAGRDLEAMRLYDEAIRSARDNGIVANEALAFELAAEFYRERGHELIADTYLSQACARYARWGAHGKVRQLERKFPQLAERPRGSPVPTEGLRAEQLDVLTVMKASQAISGKVELDELIDTLMHVVLESAGAQSATLLLLRDNAVQLAAVASVGPEGVSVQRQLGSAPTPSELPASIINYVRRTRERVRLGNATRANPFAADEYLVSRQTKSVLCLPIVRRAELVGLLYLENNLVTDAFTPGRLAVLELLAGQAAISLEIANLVETERHAREALKSSESRFRRIFESNMIGLHFGDLSGRIHEANQYLLDMLGYTREDVESGRLNWTELTPPQWEAASQAAVEQVRSFGRCLPFEKEYIRKDGTLVPALIGSSLFPGKKEEVLSFILDITERKRAESALHRSEENLRQVQKMEAIGNLAGGIAHDFNNLLSIILGYSSLLLTEMTVADPRHLYVDEISEAGTRAATLTKQLLAFGRKQMLQPKVVTLDSIVSGVERMLRRLIGEDIELTVLAQPGPGTVRVDPGQVEQIIMNLAVNSRDAMPQGGKLTLETANVELDASYAAEHQGVTAGPHVMLAVTDTGTGMDEATRARMFEPFFTTKEIGKGTGLGLSTVFGIVQQSGGSVRVDTALGKGTSIKIYFPRVDATPAELRESVSPRAAAGARAETILLVEDDPHVRTLIRTILEQFGYEVLEAQNGGDALLICEDQSQPIHLLLTDVIMPRMSGAQLAERLKPIRPTMKVLFMSGYADDSIVHQGLLKPGVAFLQKPITPETLTRKVREVLDSANQGTG